MKNLSAIFLLLLAFGFAGRAFAQPSRTGMEVAVKNFSGGNFWINRAPYTEGGHDFIGYSLKGKAWNGEIRSQGRNHKTAGVYLGTRDEAIELLEQMLDFARNGTPNRYKTLSVGGREHKLFKYKLYGGNVVTISGLHLDTARLKKFIKTMRKE